MTNDSAIPDFNSDNSVSQTDSKQSHEESAAIEDDLSNQNDVEENFVHFISSTSNFNRNLEETTVISDRKLDSQQTQTDKNSAVEETAVISDQKLDSQQTQTDKNSAVVEKSNPVEQLFNDRISIDIPLLENAIAANQKIQVEIRSEKDRLVLTLPSLSETSVCEYSWSEIWQQMKLRLLAQKRFFSSKISVHLIAYDRLLDSRQLQDIADTLSEMSLQLKSVGTSRRQTAIAAAGAGYSVEQLQPKTAFSFKSSSASLPPAEPLYMETTVRSGVEIRHRGSVIILGDVNPGGIVVADGDILIWGRLRGVAHAGAQGNSECTIMALQMEPTQLRIANALARAPEKTLTQKTAEVAYITTQGIRITNANDFSRKSINAG